MRSETELWKIDGTLENQQGTLLIREGEADKRAAALDEMQDRDLIIV